MSYKQRKISIQNLIFFLSVSAILSAFSWCVCFILSFRDILYSSLTRMQMKSHCPCNYASVCWGCGRGAPPHCSYNLARHWNWQSTLVSGTNPIVITQSRNRCCEGQTSAPRSEVSCGSHRTAFCYTYTSCIFWNVTVSHVCFCYWGCCMRNRFAVPPTCIHFHVVVYLLSGETGRT